MAQPNKRQRLLLFIAGTLSLVIGVGGVVLVLKIILESGDLAGVVSRYWQGIVSIPVLIGCGLFILQKALRCPTNECDIERRE